MRTLRLPVSGIDIIVQTPTGAEDILLLENSSEDVICALELVTALTTASNRTGIEWSALSVTDLNVLLLHLRQMVFGDLIRTDIVCPNEDCRRRIDVKFCISEYLTHHRPGKARGVEADVGNIGWFHLVNVPVSFRLPNVGDQIAALHAVSSERELIKRCIRPAMLPSRIVKRVETAMEALAPNLSHDLQGECVECDRPVTMYFDVQHFVLSELRDQARFIYEDIHLLASQYHWTQAEILALPRSRRAHYIALLQQERSLV